MVNGLSRASFQGLWPESSDFGALRDRQSNINTIEGNYPLLSLDTIEAPRVLLETEAATRAAGGRPDTGMVSQARPLSSRQ